MPEHELDNEQLLLARIKEGDEEAFHALYQRYSGKVYGMALQYLKSAFYAQDTVQEVFSRVWKHRATLTAIDHFDRWLTTVTKNLLINQLRKAIPANAAALQPVSSSGHAPNPVTDYLDYRELETLLNEAIRQLPPRQREVYELSRKAGLPHRAIAQQLGISHETTREHMSKALKNIRTILEKRYGPLGLIVCLVYAI